MTLLNPREVSEYELNPLELQARKGDWISKVWSLCLSFQLMFFFFFFLKKKNFNFNFLIYLFISN